MAISAATWDEELAKLGQLVEELEGQRETFSVTLPKNVYRGAGEQSRLLESIGDAIGVCASVKARLERWEYREQSISRTGSPSHDLAKWFRLPAPKTIETTTEQSAEILDELADRLDSEARARATRVGEPQGDIRNERCARGLLDLADYIRENRSEADLAPLPTGLTGPQMSDRYPDDWFDFVLRSGFYHRELDESPLSFRYFDPDESLEGAFRLLCERWRMAQVVWDQENDHNWKWIDRGIT